MPCVSIGSIILWCVGAMVAAPSPSEPSPRQSLRERFVTGRQGGRDTFIAARGDVEATASTALAARLIQAEAETLYRRMSIQWFDREPPSGWMPVHVWHSRLESHLPRAFLVRNKTGKIVETEIALVGDLEGALERQLPREMCKLLLARHFHDTLGGRIRPVWLQLGTPIVETLPEQEQTHQFERFRELVVQGKSRGLSDLCGLTDPYAEDRNQVLAQGYVLTRFLLTRGNRTAFLRFVETGVKSDWDKAAKEAYGYASLDKLEKAWLAWLKTPESRPAGNE